MKRLAVLFLCLFADLIIGCDSEKKAEIPIPTVKFERVSLQVGKTNVTYAGVVKGRYETNMSFQVGGQIVSRLVQLGDRVTAGQTLMKIDPKDIVQRSNQADAQVEAAKSQLNLARTNLSRFKELYAADAISTATLDQYQTAYDAATAAYQNVEAQATQAHNALSYTGLVANADGVISAVNAEAGQVVAAGQPVLTLVQTAELEVEINVPENSLTDVKLGQQAEVSFWALKDAKAVGTVREIAPMAESIARTYRVRVSLPQPPKGMNLGMTAGVAVAGKDNGRTILLPLSAIYQTGDAPNVWIVDGDNKVRLQSVSIENFSDNQVKVSGLADGDIVLTAGVHKLHEGDEVRLGTEASRP